MVNAGRPQPHAGARAARPLFLTRFAARELGPPLCILHSAFCIPKRRPRRPKDRPMMRRDNPAGVAKSYIPNLFHAFRMAPFYPLPLSAQILATLARIPLPKTPKPLPNPQNQENSSSGASRCSATMFPTVMELHHCGGGSAIFFLGPPLPFREGAAFNAFGTAMPSLSISANTASRMNCERSLYPAIVHAWLISSRNAAFTMKVSGFWSSLLPMAEPNIKKSLADRNFFLATRFELG